MQVLHAIQSVRSFGWVGAWRAARGRNVSAIPVRELQRAISCRPRADRGVLSQFWTDALPVDSRAKTIVDVGAHIGVTALRFHRAAPDARILAIEPDLENYSLLERNCEGIAAIAPLRAALWREAGTGRLRRRSGSESCHLAQEGAVVDTVTLAMLLARVPGPVDVLKIDIEGAEREVFSAPETPDCLRSVRCLIVECHEGYASGARAAVTAALARSGVRWSHRAIGEHDVWTQE